MSDKPTIKMQLSGTYRGYGVAIEIDGTLDQLDKLIDRMQQRGIEPAHQAAPASAGNGKSERKGVKCALEGIYTGHHIPARGPACKVSLMLPGNVERGIDFWGAVPSELIALGSGTKIRVEGVEKVSSDGKYVNFSVNKWERI
jgi:hypothetical protein